MFKKKWDKCKNSFLLTILTFFLCISPLPVRANDDIENTDFSDDTTEVSQEGQHESQDDEIYYEDHEIEIDSESYYGEETSNNEFSQDSNLEEDERYTEYDLSILEEDFEAESFQLMPESEDETLFEENLEFSTLDNINFLVQSAMPQEDIEKTPLPLTADGISVEKATIRWKSKSTGSDEEAKYNDLVLVPSDEKVPNQQWQLDLALSGKGFIDTGDLEIVIPAYIWKDRNGNEPGRLTLATPEEPNYDSYGFTWRRVGDTYVITNARPISAGQSYMIQGTYRMTYPDPNSDKPFTSTYAYQMVDIDTTDENAEYKGISDWLYANILILTPHNQEELNVKTNSIRATIDTSVRVSDAYKEARKNDVYVNSVPNIPDLLPENPEDYYYVRWYISGRAVGNQPYTLTLNDNLTDEYNGIILGFTDGTNQSLSDRSSSTEVYSGTSINLTKSTYVWVAYPKSSFPNPNTSYTVTNSVTAEVKGLDDEVITSKSYTAQAVIKTPRPPIVYHVDKVWEYNDDKYTTDLETIMSRRPDSVRVNFYGCNLSDTLSDANDWHTDLTDPGGYSSTCSAPTESFSGGRHSSTSPRVYRPDGSYYYTESYWEWQQRTKTYDAETNTYTFYNQYIEGVRNYSSPGFSSSFSKRATNHTNNTVRATSDRDLPLLRNNQETSEITYSVTRSLYTMPYTSNGSYNVAENLHKKTIRVELTDHTEYFNNRKLNEEEYYFTFATLPNPYVSNFQNSTTGYSSSVKIAAEMLGKTGSDWVKYAEVDESGNISTFNGATNSGSKINFPAGDVVQTKLVARTNADRITASYDIGIKIKPSQQVVDQVENEFSKTDYVMMTSKNDASFVVYDDETNSNLNSVSTSATTYLHGRNYRLAVDLDKSTSFTKNDKINRQLWFKNTITLNRVSSISTQSEFDYAVSENLISDSDSGVFYDLLPIGMRIDESSIKAVENVSIQNINIIENYKDSGRQLLIINAKLIDVASIITVPSGSSKYNDQTYPAYRNETVWGWEPSTITFSMTYSYDEVKNRGLTGLRNHSAYVADENQFGDMRYWSGEKDIPDGTNHKETLNEIRDDVRSLMTNLSESNSPNTVYAGANVYTTEVDLSALTSIVKQVSITGSDNWSFGTDNEVNVPEGGKYSYRITLTSGTDTTTKNIIILDSLENYTPIKVTNPGDSNIPVGKIISQREFNENNEVIEFQGGNLIQGEPVESWKGYFRGIDVSEITSIGVDAKVYYSTSTNLDISNYNPDGEADVVPNALSNSDVWSLIPPTDLSKVTAIAIDCRKDTNGNDFGLKENESLIAYIHMKAPTYEQQPEAFGVDYKDYLQNDHAFNNVYMDVSKQDDAGLSTHSYDHFDFTEVGIYGMDVKVKKLWDDFNDNDKIRPDNLEVELVANGVDTGRTITLSSQDNWEGFFEHVIEFDDNGNRINYSVKESVADYTSSYIKELNGNLTTITVTNKHDLYTTSYPFFKVWESEETEGWQTNIPSSIQVKLFADGVFTGKTKTITPNTNGEWAGVFTDLQKVKDGVEISYSVQEVSLSSDWITEYEDNQIKNIYYPYGDLIVKKQVVNSTPESKDNLFKFIISLKDKNDNDLIGEFVYNILDENNESVSSGLIKNGDEFELKENWLIEIKDIPSGSRYELSEENKAGYILSSKINFSNTINAAVPQESVFTNTYNTTGSISITGNKTLTGRDITRNQFRFEIYDAEDKLIRTAGNTAEGLINFGSFTYRVNDNGKEFVYTVKEINRGRPGYTYDDSVYTVKVYPVDNGDGTMTVTQNIFKNDVETQLIDFANEYHAEGEITLRAWKELEVRKLQNEEFEFELIDEGNNVIDTKKNSADGSIVFDTLHFDETDIGKTYYYAVREKLGDDPTVNYDGSVFGYALTVLDNGNGTLSISQGTASPIFGEPEEGEYFAKYAVSIWGIGQDTLEDGSTAGLTFGPAIGEDYTNSFKSHTPGGNTSSGNAHRCVHDDDWNTIIEWNNVDPFVYEQCVAENCTHSVELHEAGETIVNPNFEAKGAGDGASILYYELMQYNDSAEVSENLRWHPNNNMPNDADSYGTNYGGWGSSRVRAMLNGADSLTDIGDGTASKPGGTDTYSSDASSDIHKSASIYTSTNNLLVCFPEELQAAIGKRATKYDIIYGSETGTSYDKLWLLSSAELNFTGSTSYYHPLEGTAYQKITQNSQSIGNSENAYYRAFRFNGNTATSGSVFLWWLRSFAIRSLNFVSYVSGSGYVYRAYASSSLGISPCFSLDRSVVPTIDEQRPPIIGWETEDAELPIFKNTLKDGSLSISKLVENEENANPDQEFKFKIKLIGPGIENKQFEWEKERLPYNAYLIYDANGGQFSDGVTENKFTYLVNNNDSSLLSGEYEKPTREDYIFEGWFEDEEFNVEFTSNPEELSLLEDKRVYAKWEEVSPFAKYAVSIYGIEQDIDDTGNTMGLTFGPAIGANYTNSYKSHTPSGNTSSGNAHRCIHDDSWNTIIHWNNLDPFVYEQCVAENCTHSVKLHQAGETIINTQFSVTGEGDGASVLYNELLQYDGQTEVYENLRWHPNNNMPNNASTVGTNYGGWGASRIRAMLNGTDELTDIGDGTATKLGGTDIYARSASTDIHKSANVYTSTNNLLMCFPEELQAAIGKRKTLYDPVYNANNETSIETVYDKLWLLSPAELNYTGSSTFFEHPLEAGVTGVYQKFVRNSQSIKSGSSNANSYYKNSVKDWHLRSISMTNSTNLVALVGKDGVMYHTNADSAYGVAPCFALSRQINTSSSNNTSTEPRSKSINAAPQLNFLGSKITRNATHVTFIDGEAELTLKKNEKITFKDIPAGTAYQVWEETPDGWVLVEQRNASGEILPLETSEAEFKNRYQPGTTSVQFNGTKLLDNIAAKEGSFSFELYEGEELLETVSVLDGGFIQFSVLSYNEAGTHNYTIKEVDPNSNTIDFDTHIENITVVVRDNGDGTLSSEVTYDDDGIVFRNSTRPGTLEIKKNVDISTNANKDDVFTFEIEFTNENGVPLSSDENIYWYRKDANGNIIDDTDLLGRVQAFFTGRDTKLNSSPIGQEGFDNENDTSNEENTSAVNEEGLLEKLGLVKKVYAEEGDIASGIYRGVDWRITADGELIIGKEGEVQEFTYSNYNNYYQYKNYPWYLKSSSISSIKFVGTVKGNGSMSGMFRYSSARTIDLSNFDTSNVTDMSQMFMDTGATSINLSNFDTSNVTSMYAMFDHAKATIIDLSSFDTSNVYDMSYMFSYCQTTSLDLSSFDTSNVHIGRGIFSTNRLLDKITIGENFFASSDIYFPAAADGGNHYTGKWIKSDSSFGPYTHSQIKQYFTEDMAGTWIREVSHINFDANGGHILSEYQTVYSDKSLNGVQVPNENVIYRPHHKFKGWSETSQGTTIKYNPGSIAPNSFADDSPTLYAVWEYDGKNQINVNHYKESSEGGDYSLAETEVIRDIPGAEYSPNLNSYSGFHTISSVETATVDDKDLTTVNYYYDRDRYTVNFDGNGSFSGQMFETLNLVGGVSSALPKSMFSKKGDIFTGWNTQPDGSGITYLDQAEALNIGNHGETVTLYAQWSTNDTSVTPSNGKILVQCKAGETIVIPDLPYGTKYTIKEINVPEGWAFDSSIGEIGSVSANTVSSSQFNNKYSAEGLAFITAHKTIIGDTPQEGQFTFELYQGNTLLQSKANEIIDTNEEILGNNDENIPNPWVNTAPVEFDALQFTQEDIGKTFTYTIKEVNSGDNRINYDTHTETVRITVSDAGSGNLNCNVVYDSDGALFINSLRSSSLQLKKNIVNPTQISEETEFNFTINLKDSSGNSISGEYPVKIKHKNYNVVTREENVNPEYSHTSNIDDTGKQNGNYSNYLNTNEVISIPEAAKLVVDVYYNGESVSYDWLSVWKGNYPAYKASSDATSVGRVITSDGAPSNTNKFGGSQSGSYTVNGNNLTSVGYMRLTIPGDSVTFGFKSDNGGVGKGYGYYAIVTPMDENGNPLKRTIKEEQGFTETTISNGGTLTLKGGEELEITGLPDSATYEIVELDSPGWEITNKAGETGQIIAGETAFVEFENTYSTQGSFEPTANKILIGGDLSEESFEFIITDENGNEISKAHTDENGLVTFAPIFYDQDDDGKTYAYYIKEVIDKEREDIIWDEHLSEVVVKVEDNGEGELIATPTVTNNDLEFTNIIFGSIEVSKEVSGNLGNKTEEFNFSIEFGSAITNDITFEKYEGETKVDEGTIELTDNTYNFTLKHDESIKLNQVPKTIKYTLSEENYSSKGYTTYIDGKMKRSVTNTLKEDTKHSFENSILGVVPTEIRIRNLSALAGGISLVIIVVLLLKKRKKSYN